MDWVLANNYSTGMTEIRKAEAHPCSVCTLILGNIEIWRGSFAVMEVLCTSAKICMKLEGRKTFHACLFGALQSMIFG